MKIPLSIYIHVPFCPAKCLYCDFLSHPGGEAVFDSYVAALCNHIKTKAPLFAEYRVETISFGGGTPTVLPTAHLSQILNAIKSEFDLADGISITIEANPETVDAAYLSNLHNMGVNRISFGVQSFDDKLLAAIGRIHTAERAIQAIELAAKTGFNGINLDLMFALPHQTVTDFEKSLDFAISLPITHISCYALTIEENTPLARRDDLLPTICDEITDRKMYHLAAEKLAAAGFNHYEISNWAKPGHACRHNNGYWTHRQYIGFGTGAHSFMSNTRFRNTSNLIKYINGDFVPRETEKVDTQTAMSEYIFLGLRLTDGISAAHFKTRFATDIHTHFAKQLQTLKNQGLIAINVDNIRLTKKGLDLANTVFAEFI